MKNETSKKKSLTSRKLKILKVSLVLVFFLAAWIFIDLFGPWSANLRQFDPVVIGKLETQMWRAYYDKKSFHLYLLLIEMLQEKNKLPFWQANLNAYRATRAAFIFKKGSNRTDYKKALPYLTTYFRSINEIGHLKGDPNKIAQLELEWWIVHREHKTYGEPALANAIAATIGEFYSIDPTTLKDYAQARTTAMLQRDAYQEMGQVTEDNWKQIEQNLIQAYTSLTKELDKQKL